MENNTKNMDFNTLLTKLIYLTKRNNISNTEIGIAINVERRAMSGRAERNSKFKPNEIEQIENAFNVKLSDAFITPNSLEENNDITIPMKVETFGKRLSVIQDKYEYLDKEMAKRLRISEEDYIDLKCGNIEPTFKILVRLKQCFRVSIDWLLFGE